MLYVTCTEIDKASYDYYKITLYISISKDLVLYNCTAKQQHVTGGLSGDWVTLILVVMTTEHVGWEQRSDWAARDVPEYTSVIQGHVKILAGLKFKLRLVTTKPRLSNH